ncbi:MAG: DNA translocase FtsK [Defluviitaleaceae bacterium]|nr:DNA translocase FtsK [Defluviitaleaceae bacterium]
MATKKDTKTKGKAKKNGVKPQKSGIRHEIIAIAIIAAAILVLVSLFMEDAGIVGRLVNSLLLGLFGIGAFVLPVAALILGGLLFAGKMGDVPKSKIIMGSVTYVLLISIAHMVGSSQPEDMGPFQYIAYIFVEGGASGGGLLGAALSRLFIAAISEIGTYILFITASAILVMQITGWSLFSGMKWGYSSAKDRVENINERRAARREERYQEYEEYEEYDEEEYEEEFVAPAPVRVPEIRGEDYGYSAPTKKPRNMLLDEDGYAQSVEEIMLAKDTIKNRGAGQKLEDRPKSPQNLILVPEFEKYESPSVDVDFEPDFEPEPEPIFEETEEDFSINVMGIVEGYQPEVAQLQDEEEYIEEEIEEVVFDLPLEEEIEITAEKMEYIFPPVELLRENTYQPSLSSRAQILENSKKLEETLKSFGVAARVVEVSKGPTVTRYELSPGAGVKVSKISGLADDLALNLAAQGIRIEAPIPGKSVVGIEIPNKETQAVFLREVIDDDAFWSSQSKLSFAMGKDIAGNIVVSDIAKMPHLLIAGSTGAGKSVCINTLITSIVYKASPAEVKLLMIDPKVVELSIYNGIPHLLIPVVTDPKKASGALAWGVREMDERYEKFAQAKVRDLAGFNAYLTAEGEETLPQIVIIIDELADLMMTCGKEVEESICRLAQKARAAGIHLIIATQRPSVDVITGLIKANVPSRLAFAVSSGTDSRTILDMVGAEKLLGKGDMLFSPVGLSKPRRIQGSFISDKEVENIVNFIKQDGVAEYDEAMIDKITAVPEGGEASGDSDPLIEEAIAFIVEREKASTSMLQRRFRIGYNRAARMMEELVARGLVGPEDGAKPRKVLMTSYQHREYLERRKES